MLMQYDNRDDNLIERPTNLFFIYAVQHSTNNLTHQLLVINKNMNPAR